MPGVRVRADNKVEWDPDIERVYLPSGKPLVRLLEYLYHADQHVFVYFFIDNPYPSELLVQVPDYAMTFVGGSSCK